MAARRPPAPPPLNLAPPDIRAIERELRGIGAEPYITQGSNASDDHPHGWWLFAERQGEARAQVLAERARAREFDLAHAQKIGHWLVLLRPVTREDLKFQEELRDKEKRKALGTPSASKHHEPLEET